MGIINSTQFPESSGVLYENVYSVVVLRQSTPQKLPGACWNRLLGPAPGISDSPVSSSPTSCISKKFPSDTHSSVQKAHWELLTRTIFYRDWRVHRFAANISSVHSHQRPCFAKKKGSHQWKWRLVCIRKSFLLLIAWNGRYESGIQTTGVLKYSFWRHNLRFGARHTWRWILALPSLALWLWVPLNLRLLICCHNNDGYLVR